MTSSSLRIVLLCAPLVGCYALSSSEGGGAAVAPQERLPRPADIELPADYRIEPVATGLVFPVGVAFDDSGGVYVVESGYCYGEVFTTPRILRVLPAERREVLVEGGETGPWTGASWHEGAFYVSMGNVLGEGRVVRLSPDGEEQVLAGGLPSRGDHHTNAPVLGPDGWLYFGLGTATNSGVVGPDNADFGWLKRFPGFHDVPGADVISNGAEFESEDVLAPDEEGLDLVLTGAYAPFGAVTEAGAVVPGQVAASGSILRVRPEGGPLEQVAWGLRNPFGLAFDAQGALLVTDHMYDQRGSRPVYGAGDLLWRVEPGRWYGWPDFHAGRPLWTGERYAPPGEDAPRRLLAEHPGEPPSPLAIFAAHSGSSGFDVSRSEAFGHVGDAFVAQFGDEAPTVGKVLAPVGYKVVRVDLDEGLVTDFAINRGEENGPASLLRTGGLERPVSARFDPAGAALYVVDFGVVLHHGAGARPIPGTGVLWRITHEEAAP